MGRPPYMPRRGGLHRRTLLKGMLAGSVVTVGLPALELFYDPPISVIASPRARAECATFPKRFGVWYWGNGVIPDRWTPTGSGTDWEPSEQLMPLLALKPKLTVVSGTRVVTPNAVPHGSGPAGMLSGGDMMSPDGNASSGTFPGPGIDQIIAAAIGDRTRFPSLELGVQRSDQSISFSGPHAMNPPETSPMALFERIFGVGFRDPDDTSGPDPRLGLRRSVLDVVNAQAGSLRPRLGIADRARLDAHLEGVRAIELQIARLSADPPSLAACMRPETMPDPDYPDRDGRPQMEIINGVMADLLAMTLACDQTRVFTYMFSQAVNNVLFGMHTAGHHQLTHDEPGEQPEVNEIVVSIMAMLATFLTKLDGIPEGDGETLLDHSAILCTTDVSLGRTHSLENFPIVLAGSCCGTLRTGIHYVSPGAENVCRLSLSLLRAMELPQASFGSGPASTTDGLSGIEVA